MGKLIMVLGCMPEETMKQSNLLHGKKWGHSQLHELLLRNRFFPLYYYYKERDRFIRLLLLGYHCIVFCTRSV